MKIMNVKNKFRSILHGVGHFPCSTGSQEKVLHYRGAILDDENTKGITLIALIITIILMLILAGVVLNFAIRRKRNI